MTSDSRPVAVVTLGECMGSFIARQPGSMAEAPDFLRTVAGAEANVAVGLARLGVRSSYIGRVGADALGTAVIRRLRGEGVGVEHLHVDDSATTGVMIREHREIGPAEVIYWRSGSAGARLTVDDIAAAGEAFDTAGWLHLTGITPALSEGAAAAVTAAVGLASERGLTISLDVNMRRRLWLEPEARSALRPLIARSGIVFGSADELAVMAGLAASMEAGRQVPAEEAADAVLALGPATVVVKLGADGALLRQRGEAGIRSVSAPALQVTRVIDVVGAGDAFCAGYIATRLGGASDDEALRVGNACGAAAVASLGDQAGLPTRGELALLLTSGGADVLR